MSRPRPGRSSLLFFGLALLAAPGQITAQNVSIPLDLWNAKLAFSSDGRVLHATGETPEPSKSQHVRAIAYSAATGAVLHTVNLEAGTTVLATTSDGRTAIVAAGVAGSSDHTQLLRLDTESGKTEPLPAAWYDPKDDTPEAQLSSDGRLLSIYSENGPEGRPMSVAVYAWPGKTLVARQTSQYTNAGGIFGGGVTPDGRAVEFRNNRSGSVLVDRKTGHEMASFGPGALRSPTGQWVLELPNLSFQDESAPREVLIEDGNNGKRLGKIDVPVPDDVAYGGMSGAFCGSTPRFILASGHGVAAYAIPSGALLASFPTDTWRDPASPNPDRAFVVCSPTAKRVAIVSGTRLTFHDLK